MLGESWKGRETYTLRWTFPLLNHVTQWRLSCKMQFSIIKPLHIVRHSFQPVAFKNEIARTFDTWVVKQTHVLARAVWLQSNVINRTKVAILHPEYR